RPALERVGVEAGGVIGIKGVEFEAEFKPLGDLGERHRRQNPINGRQACQKPRTAASVARVGCGACSAPPISITEHSSSPPLIARWMKPPTAPSSIET